MKKLLLCKCMLVLIGMMCSVCFSASAVTLKQKNAFAFDIRVDASDSMHPVVSYKLNGTASAVGIEVYCYNNLVKTVAGTTNDQNAVSVSMNDVPDGTITFNVVATTATPVATPTQIAWADGYAQKYYKYWAPWGLAVNNCTDSETFGQLVVCETRYYTTQGTSTAYLSGAGNNGQGAMLYPYNAWFEPIKNGTKYGFNPGITKNQKQYKQYTTSYTGSEYVATFADVEFSDDGRLFLACGDPYVTDVTGPIYECNPNDLNAAATPVFPNPTTNYSKTKAGAVQAMDAVGKGADLKIAIVTTKDGLTASSYYEGYIYKLGTAQTWTAAPSATLNQNAMGSISYQFRQCLAFDADGKGLTISRYNTWGSNYRYSNGETGVNISYEKVPDNGVSQGIALNHDGTIMARQMGAKNITVYSCANANGNCSLTELYSFNPGVGTYINDIAFDYADNLYCCSNSGEIVTAWQLPPVSGSEKVVSVPAPANQAFELVKTSTTDLYVATNWGDDNNWNPEAAVQMDYDKGIYSITLPAGVNEFKLSTQRGNWDTFNSDIYIVGSNMVIGDYRDAKKYDLHQGSYHDGATENIVLAQAAEPWTVFIDYNNMKIWAEQPLKLYVRGSMTNDWSAHADWLLTPNAKGVYTLTGVNIDAEHEWKIAEAPMSWNKYNNSDSEQDGYSGWERHNYGGHPNIKANRTKTVEGNGANCSLDRNVQNATITYDHANKTIKVTHTPDAVRPGHAFDFSTNVSADGSTTEITFKSTAAGTGRIILTPTTFEEEAEANGSNNAPALAPAYVRDNITINEGENTVSFNAADFDTHNIYRVSVEYDHETNYAFQVVDQYDGESKSTRGGVAVIKDQASPLYGYIITSNGNAKGLWLHKPDFSETQKYSVGEPFSDNTTSSFRMTYYNGKAYVTDQTAATGGIYTWDPANPEEPATIVYDGTYTAPWWKDENNNLIGGRATSVKIVEDEEGNPQMWAFITNPITWNDYKVVCSNFDENGKISTAPVVTYVKPANYSSGRLGNQNVDMWHSKLHNGFWVSQERGNGSNTISNPSFMFVNLDGGVANAYSLSNSIAGVDGGRNAIAVNEDETLLFYSTRESDIAVCDLEWNGNVPTATFIQTIPGTTNTGGYYQFDFDPAGNLVAWGANSKVLVVAVEQQAQTKTMTAPGNVGFTMNDDGTMTSVNDIIADIDSDATFYNLNGVQVSGDKLMPGIYVKVKGNKATKVVVK